MTNTNHQDDRAAKWLRRIARLISIPLILYAFLLFVGYAWSWITTGVPDPHAAEDYPFIENLPPWFMFIAIVGLAMAWRWEKIGGIVNLVFCLLTVPVLFIHWPLSGDARYLMPYILLLIISFPGILFLLSWQRSKKTVSKNRY